MRTSKPFSTISYNTKDFLTRKLWAFEQAGLIDFWAYIEHLPEHDEKKAHKHLYVVPARLLDTNGTFRDNLKEIDPANPLAKPLGIINCVSSKFQDWYFYTLHNAEYLASKGQTRKYYYTDADYVTSCGDYFRELKHQIDYSKVNRQVVVKQAIDDGETFESLVKRGVIPVPLINQYRAFYDVVSGQIRDVYAVRADRETHTPKDDVSDDVGGWIELNELIKQRIEKS